MPGEVTGRVTGQDTGHQSAAKTGAAWTQWRAAQQLFLSAAAADQPWQWKGGPPVSPWQGRWSIFWNNPLGPLTPADYAVVNALAAYNRAVDAVIAAGAQGDDSPGDADVTGNVGRLGLPGGRDGVAALQDELTNQTADFPGSFVYGLTLADQLDGVRTGRQPQAGDGVPVAMGLQIGQTSQGGWAQPENDQEGD